MANPKDEANGALMTAILSGATNLSDEQKSQLKQNLTKLMAGFDSQLKKLSETNQAMMATEDNRKTLKVVAAQVMVGNFENIKKVSPDQLFAVGAKAFDQINTLLDENKKALDKKKTHAFITRSIGSEEPASPSSRRLK